MNISIYIVLRCIHWDAEFKTPLHHWINVNDMFHDKIDLTYHSSSCEHQHNEENCQIKETQMQFFNYRFNYNYYSKKPPQKPTYCQKLEKTIFRLRFKYNLSSKNNHQNQDITKSCTNHFFNNFSIKTLIRQSNHQNQELPKAGKIHFSIPFQL